jgi:hypothetical protein
VGSSLVLMDMVHIRDVGVDMSHRLVLVKMRMRLAGRINGTVRMMMVFIMHMWMGVGHRSMEVLMLMMLGQVQPHSHRHQYTCAQQLRRNWIAQCDDRGHAANEWRGRKVCTGACSAEAASRENKQNQADTVAEKTDDTSNERG